MTATEPAALAEWEVDLLTYGTAFAATADTIRDPGYLAFRLGQALELAQAHRTDTGNDYSGFEMLRMMVQCLQGEAKQFTDAGTEFFAMLQASHPDVRWLRGSGGGFLGCPPDRRDDEAVRSACETAARQLRLIEKRRYAATGARRWRGEHEGWEIIVVDR